MSRKRNTVDACIDWGLYAVTTGNVEVVESLLHHGADVNLVDSGDRTPLMEAAWRGDTELVAMLLKAGTNLDLTDEKGRTAAMIAEQRGHRGLVDLLKNAN
jgi:ankyrin repeat protein